MVDIVHSRILGVFKPKSIEEFVWLLFDARNRPGRSKLCL